MSYFDEIQLEYFWERDDVNIPNSDEKIFEDPFITHNSLHSGERLSPMQTVRPKASNNLDMNFTTLSKGTKSPWHESDSGISTMSEARSPPSFDLTGSEDLAQPIVDWTVFGENTEDLASYLLGTDISMVGSEGAISLHEEKQNYSVPVEVLPKKNQVAFNIVNNMANHTTVSNQIFPIDLEKEASIDVENSDSECSLNGGISPERANSQISEPLNYFQEICGETKRKPAVKIVKVLKTSAGSDCCDDDIVKALDERSKKNAIQAKMNREKKKKYVSSLEKDVEKLGKENDNLRSENLELKKELGSLEEEVRYLKSVLVNASPLASMLRNISGVSEVKLSASIVGRKRGAVDCDDHSYTEKKKNDNGRVERSAKRAKMVQANLEKAGVCLHVSGSEASLEFCSQCSLLARQSHSQTKKT